MVYIAKWTQFESAVIDLYNKSPRKTRYVVRFVPSTGHLVLKVTDDTTCLQYKSFSAIILNRFESLNLRLLSNIGNVRRRVPVLSGGSSAATPAVEGDDPIAAAVKSGPASGTATPAIGASSPAPTPAPAAGGGGKKKKKKGKK